MAFALALQSVHDLPEGHGQTIFTATTAIVVLTVHKLISEYRGHIFPNIFEDSYIVLPFVKILIMN